MSSTYIRNGRGSAHSHIPWSTWQRHTPQCVARGYVTKNGGLPCTDKCRSSRYSQEMRVTALLNAVSLTGRSVAIGSTPISVSNWDSIRDFGLATFVCPLTGERVPISGAHADRAVPGHAGGIYEPSNVVLVSAGANLARDLVPHDESAYVEDVAKASTKVRRVMGVPKGIAIPDTWRSLVGGTECEARPNVEGVANGPYGL